MDWPSMQHNRQQRLSHTARSRDEQCLPNQSLSPSHGTIPTGGLEFQNNDEVVSPLTNISLDQFIQDPVYLQSQETLRSLLFSTAQSTVPTRAPSPVQDGQPHAISTRGIMSSRKRIEYLKNYVAEVAPWLDMFDMQRTFGIRIMAMSQNCPALFYAILALSARQMERMNEIRGVYDSLELYQEAIRLVTPLLHARHLDALIVCVILCCLEMMSASAKDWRRHLEGCAALFDTFNINGFSGGVLQAVFWCYTRMDLCGALISDGTESTLLHLEKWLPPGTHENRVRKLFCDAGSDDMYANYAVYLCSKVCELIADRTKYTELGEDNGCSTDVFAERWVRLWDELQLWMRDRPSGICPVIEAEGKPFPRVLFVHWGAISSTQLIHTACILLLDMTPHKVRLQSSSSTSKLWHAKQICGISLANPHHGCLNNAVQPLWIAGRLFSHGREHSAVVKLIRSIEAMTGWGTCWRIADLERTWGYT
ncbi:transcriptional regulator family: Fungal Specific TF [Paecilomyces variotii]|nr:transcriptional regulator family: Fungal Specific TF [Paecilomyces variotii]KAJ9288078.1 transcriptional regulator family: Fungal Specific TF [Paecilomyces variotii]KAJ9329004.1 transcriptional regulator family: Fungal Specific TF [Paecilomyces variotii]KAJ9335875.1 transcriptional regulator family: Fungal Specific TF [Paecilomyces variotii]KAJ9370716.1 transcriptional regulator family: Fungal Specific TF [Paecilomyces variotii]